MDRYTVKTGGGRTIYGGNDIEEATYQRDEFQYEYPEIGASIHHNF